MQERVPPLNQRRRQLARQGEIRLFGHPSNKAAKAEARRGAQEAFVASLPQAQLDRSLDHINSGTSLATVEDVGYVLRHADEFGIPLQPETIDKLRDAVKRASS